MPLGQQQSRWAHPILVDLGSLVAGGLGRGDRGSNTTFLNQVGTYPAGRFLAISGPDGCLRRVVVLRSAASPYPTKRFDPGAASLDRRMPARCDADRADSLLIGTGLPAARYVSSTLRKSSCDCRREGESRSTNAGGLKANRPSEDGTKLLIQKDIKDVMYPLG